MSTISCAALSMLILARPMRVAADFLVSATVLGSLSRRMPCPGNTLALLPTQPPPPLFLPLLFRFAGPPPLLFVDRFFFLRLACSCFALRSAFSMFFTSITNAFLAATAACRCGRGIVLPPPPFPPPLVDIVHSMEHCCGGRAQSG